MSVLPSDVVIQILLRVPVKPLHRMKVVSKRWLSLITAPFFIRQHFKTAKQINPRILFTKKPSNFSSKISLHSIQYDSTDKMSVSYNLSLGTKSLSIVGSCNGLVCLFDHTSDIVLCNPATSEYKLIEFPSNQSRICVLGFGHDPVEDEYKVVRFDIRYSRTRMLYDNCEIYVYTLGTKPVWRRIIKSGAAHMFTKRSGTYLNGTLHWLKLTNSCRGPRQVACILSFDIRKEKFRTLPSPTKKEVSECSILLGVFRETLATYAYYYLHNGPLEHFDVWLRNAEGSWTKELSINCLNITTGLGVPAPLDILQNGKGLLVQPRVLKLRFRKQCLYIYNQENDELGIYNCGISNWTGVHTYVESLVSVATLSRGRDEKEKTRRKRSRGKEIVEKAKKSRKHE